MGLLVKMGGCGNGGAHFSRSRVLLALIFFSWGLVSLSSAARLSVSRQKLEVQKRLKRLNKPAVKSIEVLLHSLKLCLFDEKVREIKCILTVKCFKKLVQVQFYSGFISLV